MTNDKEHIMFRARDDVTIHKFEELKAYFKARYGVVSNAQAFRLLVAQQHNLLFYDEEDDG